MGDTDTPDFNKTRGFLIGFSVLTLLLWFFGINLTKLNLLGNEVELHQNIIHTWGVIALANMYLWLRFMQRLPERGLCFDDKMHSLIDECLIRVCKIRFRNAAFQVASRETGTGDKLRRVEMTGHMSYVDHLIREGASGEGAPVGPWSYRYPSRAKVQFTLTSTIDRKGQIVTSYGGSGYEADPSRFLYHSAVIYAFAKGMIVHSWFSDNVWPLVIGCLSTGIALHKWLQINHFLA